MKEDVFEVFDKLEDEGNSMKLGGSWGVRSATCTAVGFGSGTSARQLPSWPESERRLATKRN